MRIIIQSSREPPGAMLANPFHHALDLSDILH